VRNPNREERRWIIGFVILVVIMLMLAMIGCYFNPTPLP